MKNLSLILNAVLLIAVAFLYYKVYAAKNNSSPAPIAVPVGASSIVYVNSDSLLDNYPFFTELKNSLEKKQDSIENILKGRGRLLENDIKSYQEKGATMTDQERQVTEEGLGKRQQELMSYKEDMTNEMAKAEEITTKVISLITESCYLAKQQHIITCENCYGNAACKKYQKLVSDLERY